MTAASLHPNHRPSRPEARRARGRIALAALAGMLALATQTAWSQAASRLEKVELHPQPGEQVEVRLVLDGPAPAPVTFTIDNPARLAVDLPGTALALDSRRIDVKAGGVDTIVAAEASGRTRLVFNLDRMQPYNVRTEGNTVFVTVGGGAMATAAAPAATTAAQAAAAPTGGATTIEKVDFRRTPDGGGRIVVQTIGGARTQASLKREGGRLVVDFPNTQVGADQARRYDVTDFATPINSFDVTGSPTGARIVVAATGDYEQAAYQTDREYALELKPVSKAAAAAQEKKEYKGERLTLNFQDIETRAVLQLLAETSGQNIVVSDTVQGNVTLRLQNVPWDQALDIVLRTKGLDKRDEGNVIYVAPSEELAAREKQMLEARKAVAELSPVRTEYLQVNYAKASDLASLIKSQGKSSLLSERGSISIDERTNTLLLQDTAERLADIRRLVSTLDIPVRQVLIEARIVIVNDDFSRELGVRFGGAAVFNHGGSDGMGFVGSERSRHRARRVRPDPRPERRRRRWRPGHDADGRRPLHGQPADREPGGPDRDDPARLRLRGRPRDHRRAERRPRRGGLGTARHHGERQGGGDRAGPGDPVPGIVLERRHDDAVQEGRAGTQGNAADHPRRPHHPRPDGQQGQRRRRGAERHGRIRAEHRHARDHDAGAGQRRPDRRPGRHPGDGAPRQRQQGALSRRYPGSRRAVPQQVTDRQQG